MILPRTHSIPDFFDDTGNGDEHRIDCVWWSANRESVRIGSQPGTPGSALAGSTTCTHRYVRCVTRARCLVRDPSRKSKRNHESSPDAPAGVSGWSGVT